MLQNKLPENFSRAIRSVIPSFDGDGSRNIIDYSIDSFDLMTLRSVLEEDLKIRYDDADWVKIKKFSEYFTKAELASTYQFLTTGSATLSRDYVLNMPQMNVSGLYEYWYLKEIGDMHWRLIASALDVPSDQILDEAGNRLYATFVRIKFASTKNFQSFKENDPIHLGCELSRFGNFFLSENNLQSEKKSIRAELVTSFVSRGTGNSDLYKSVPVEEPKINLKNYTAMPAFIEEYHRVRRSLEEKSTVLFEDEYQLDPYHDLNGVGLLYFAAYPHIFDVSERKFMNKSGSKDWAFRASTLSRDIYYLGNLDLNDSIVYRLLDHSVKASVHRFTSELIRKSDGKRVSYCICEKGEAL